MPKGFVAISDDEIIRLFSEGKFIRQISHEYFVGIRRVRKVIRERGCDHVHP